MGPHLSMRGSLLSSCVLHETPTALCYQGSRALMLAAKQGLQKAVVVLT